MAASAADKGSHCTNVRPLFLFSYRTRVIPTGLHPMRVLYSSRRAIRACTMRSSGGKTIDTVYVAYTFPDERMENPFDTNGKAKGSTVPKELTENVVEPGQLYFSLRENANKWLTKEIAQMKEAPTLLCLMEMTGPDTFREHYRAVFGEGGCGNQRYQLAMFGCGSISMQSRDAAKIEAEVSDLLALVEGSSLVPGSCGPKESSCTFADGTNGVPAADRCGA
ncbi:unnamed protein product [Amoebophrya sp. A120]|nr:unnamed protein product [Amoebophrya sp. A120]|eukprot:GSA120T00016060001.1